MEKLYLPTTTLNFNNIFSSESISPQSFYPIRSYGYKRFTTIKPNPFSNSILLYNKYPLYDLVDIEKDNYPIIIEFSEDFFNEENITCVSEEDGVKIFQVNSTLYLNPFQVKVFFKNQSQLDWIIVKSEQSLETKMVPVYKNSFTCESKELVTFKWGESFLSNLKDTSALNITEAIERDRKINRIKGFAYCYLIGANISLPPELIDLKKMSREIRNIVSALINIYSNSSVQKKISYSRKVPSTRDTVLEVNERINDLKKKTYRFKNISQSLIINENEELKTQNDYFLKFGINVNEQKKVINFLVSIKIGNATLFDSFKNFLRSQSESNSLSKLPEYLDRLVTIISEMFEIQDTDNNKSRIDYIDKLLLFIENSVKYMEDEIHSKSEKFQIEASLAFANFRLTSLTDKYLKGKDEFYQALINDFLYYPIEGVEDFKINKTKLALDGGKVFLEFMKYRESNKEKAYIDGLKSYINGLLDHIESYKSFDIKSNNSDILQSFSCFIIKGDNPDKLIDYLIINNIFDFRIALGFWGSIFGFANIPKTLTDSLFSFENEYINSFYKFISKQVLSVEITDSAKIVTYHLPSALSSSVKEIELPFSTGAGSTFPENEVFTDSLWVKLQPYIKNLTNTQQKKIKSSYDYVLSFPGNKWSSDTEFFVNHLKKEANKKSKAKPETKINDEIITLVKNALESLMQK